MRSMPSEELRAAFDELGASGGDYRAVQVGNYGQMQGQAGAGLAARGGGLFAAANANNDGARSDGLSLPQGGADPTTDERRAGGHPASATGPRTQQGMNPA